MNVVKLINHSYADLDSLQREAFRISKAAKVVVEYYFDNINSHVNPTDSFLLLDLRYRTISDNLSEMNGGLRNFKTTNCFRVLQKDCG